MLPQKDLLKGVVVLVAGVVALTLLGEGVRQGDDALRIMLVGDSITHGSHSSTGNGYRAPLWCALTNLGYRVDFVGTQTDSYGRFDPLLGDPDHEGISGITLGGMINRIDGVFDKCGEVDCVLLHLGTNESLKGRNVFVNEATNRLVRLLDRIYARSPRASVVVTTLMPRRTDVTKAEGNWKYADIVNVFNPAVPQIVERQRSKGQKAFFLDMHSVVGFENLDDGLHPNDIGYKKMAKAWLGAVTNIFPCPAARGAAAEGFSVVGPDAPKAWERTAVEELRHYLGLCLGQSKLTVEGKGGVVFHVGDTAFARDRGMSPDSLRDEEWLVKSFGRDVVLVGGGTRGTLYAVYHFLEDECGVRWWGDDDEDVPPAKPLAFGALDRRGKPFFICRNIYRCYPVEGKPDPRTAIRNRLNDNGESPIPAELGGAFTYGPPSHAHTWNMYLPFAKYGATHPEWYALVNGRRIGGHREGQMCLTCPGLTDEFARRLDEYIAKGESDAAAKGLPAPRIYDISMNDNRNFCTCDACMAATAKYGHSGRQLNFVHAVIRKAAAKHPDLLFSTLAYFHSEQPPSNGVCAADQVAVRLCNTRQNMAAGIFDESNRTMHDLVLAWKNHAKNLFVWEYCVTYGKGSGYPFPNENYILEKFRFYADNGVKGFFLEHEHPACSDMYELKFHLECRAMEDPYQDGAALVDDFMTRYYGAAGGRIRAARRLLDRRRREKGAFVSWFPTTGEFNFLSDGDLAEIERTFNAAAASVKGDAKRERRVDRAYSSFRRLTEIRRRFGARHPPEKGISDKPFFDFPASSKVYALYDPANVGYVQDPDLGDPLAGGETVVRFKADGDKLYGLPFNLGVYDGVNRRLVADRRWEKPLGKGYQWYSLGRVKLPVNFYLFATRKWTTQLTIGLPGMNGNEFEIRALVKFTGPLFFEGSTEPNEIRIARFVYVEP